MNDPSWIALLPTVLAIVLAIWSRQVYVSLAAASGSVGPSWRVGTR